MLSPLEFLFRWAEPGDLIIWCTYRDDDRLSLPPGTMAWGGPRPGPLRKYTVCRHHFRTLLPLREILNDHGLPTSHENELINSFMQHGALQVERVMPRVGQYASSCKTCQKERGRPWARPRKALRSYR